MPGNREGELEKSINDERSSDVGSREYGKDEEFRPGYEGSKGKNYDRNDKDLDLGKPRGMPEKHDTSKDVGKNYKKDDYKKEQKF
jgi:hypothetical protein